MKERANKVIRWIGWNQFGINSTSNAKQLGCHQWFPMQQHRGSKAKVKEVLYNAVIIFDSSLLILKLYWSSSKFQNFESSLKTQKPWTHPNGIIVKSTVWTASRCPGKNSVSTAINHMARFIHIFEGLKRVWCTLRHNMLNLVPYIPLF